MTKTDIKRLLGDIKLGTLYLSPHYSLAQRGAKWIQDFYNYPKNNDRSYMILTLIELT